MKFKLPEAIEVLSRTPAVLEILLNDLPENWVMNNEGESTWSAFDIVGHYIHGEKTDWIPRMQIILSEEPDKSFTPFDRFAQFEESKGKTLDQLLKEFKQLRKENLQKLSAANLSEADLEKQGIHPQFGVVSLKQLLSTWVVHDLAHINQVCRVLAKQYQDEIGPWKEYISVITTK